MKRVASRQNPVVARYRAVARGAEPDLLLLDGPHLVDEALASGVVVEHAVVASDSLNRPETTALLTRLDRVRVECVSAPSPVMALISPVRSPSAIVALARRPSNTTTAYAAPAPLVIIASDIQDPGNLGAIIRVAEAAGATGVVVTGTSADPFGWKALRGSMGSALRLPVTACPRAADAVAEARAAHCRIVATTPRDGTPLTQVRLTGATAVVVGSEGVGLPSQILDIADERLSIPMEAPVDSLNVAVATALIVFEAHRQRTWRP